MKYLSRLAGEEVAQAFIALCLPSCKAGFPDVVTYHQLQGMSVQVEETVNRKFNYYLNKKVT